MEIESFGAKDIMQILQVETKKVIENYIRNQLQEDIVADQISMEEYLDPFTGEEIKKRKKKQ